MPRGSVNTAPGQGPPLDGWVLDQNTGLFLASSLLRGINARTGEPRDVAVTESGEVLTHSGSEDLAPPRALQYARNPNDAMRVVQDAVGVTQNVNVAAALPAGSNVVGVVNLAYTQAAWHSGVAASSMDPREQHREMSLHTFQNQRARWTIT